MNYRRMSVSRLVVLAIVLVLSAAGAAFADVRLPAVIGDNMVLQQQTAVPIWGWAEPDEKVTIRKLAIL